MIACHNVFGFKIKLPGNTSAAIQGAPVTTLDIDFCIKENDETVAKLTKVAEELGKRSQACALQKISISNDRSRDCALHFLSLDIGD